ncbi:hypothetical protein HDF16_005966 [Granulicella aggregans]|uniref:Uncharacterized protein n=1 Tax=Granulicella aggregans TaxID=474949 RepID=A0A7W7ZJS8_9BACT|nr:hypothetical protein [Granulicella aggregans]
MPVQCRPYTTGNINGRTNATCIPSAFIGCPFGNDAGRPISRSNNCINGKMKHSPSTSTHAPTRKENQVATIGEANQTMLDARVPGKPPTNVVLTSLCACAISIAKIIAQGGTPPV